MSADLTVRAKAGDGDARMELARAASKAGKRAEAEHWIIEAAAAGQQAALFQTGVWKLVGYRGPRDVEAGTAIVRATASAGEAQAKTLLATLLVSDLLGPRDWTAAKKLLLEAAEAHDPRALLQIALMLPHERKWQETRLALADRAAGKGFSTALYMSGRMLLEQGGQESQALARLTAAARANEPNALKLLRSRRAPAADLSSPVFQLTQVSWPRVADAVQWPHTRLLPHPVARQSAPRIATLNRLLSGEECDYLISRGTPHLRRPLLQGTQTPDMRTNTTAVFGLIESDALIQSLDELVCRALGEPSAQGENLALLHYVPGQIFAPHHDWIDPNDPARSAAIAGGQRIKTLIVYLNEGYEGGETVFPRIGWRFKGKRGDALMWDNLDAAGAPDPRTLHEGTGPRSSDKFVLSKWMRDKPQPASSR
jgi:hypothetical protein